MVKLETVKITGAPLTLLPRICFFWGGGTIFEEFNNVPNKSLVTHLLVAARVLLTKCWKQADRPAKAQWYEKARYVCLIDKLTAISENR